jgi:hypothetical protein
MCMCCEHCVIDRVHVDDARPIRLYTTPTRTHALADDAIALSTAHTLYLHQDDADVAPPPMSLEEAARLLALPVPAERAGVTLCVGYGEHESRSR